MLFLNISPMGDRIDMTTLNLAFSFQTGDLCQADLAQGRRGQRSDGRRRTKLA